MRNVALKRLSTLLTNSVPVACKIIGISFEKLILYFKIIQHVTHFIVYQTISILKLFPKARSDGGKKILSVRRIFPKLCQKIVCQEAVILGNR